MKKTWLGLLLLSLLAFVASGCSSARPSASADSLYDSAARPPETGTNIPRRMHDRSSHSAEPRRVKRAKVKREKPPQREKASKPKVDEEVITRGGFR